MNLLELVWHPFWSSFSIVLFWTNDQTTVSLISENINVLEVLQKCSKILLFYGCSENIHSARRQDLCVLELLLVCLKIMRVSAGQREITFYLRERNGNIYVIYFTASHQQWKFLLVLNSYFLKLELPIVKNQ